METNINHDLIIGNDSERLEDLQIQCNATSKKLRLVRFLFKIFGKLYDYMTDKEREYLQGLQNISTICNEDLTIKRDEMVIYKDDMIEVYKKNGKVYAVPTNFLV